MHLKKLTDKELLTLAMLASGSPPRSSPDYQLNYQRARRKIPNLTDQERYKLTRAQRDVYKAMREVMSLTRPKKR